MWLGVGTANENHGLYDDKAGKWILSAGSANTWTFVGNVTGNADTSTQVKVTDATYAISHDYILMSATAPTNTATAHTVLSAKGMWVNSADKGKFELVLGTSTATSSTGGQYGQLALYSESTAGTYLKAASGTAWKTATLPAATGMLAMIENSTAKGSNTKPIKVAATGLITECSDYAGGTAVTLNGTSAAASTASFYAPTASGTANHVLIGAGSAAPVWTVNATLASDTSTTANTAAWDVLTLGNSANVTTTTAHSQGKIVIYSAATTAATITTTTGTNITSLNILGSTSTTKNTAAYSDLILGNSANVSTTTAHSEGRLFLYSAATKAHIIKGTSTTTEYTHTLPNATGTIAHTNSTMTGTWNGTEIGLTYGGTGASSLAGARTNLGIGHIYYGTCDTAAATAAKVVACPEYTTLTTGDIVYVYFTNTNTAAKSSITLNVNSTGAKNIYGDRPGDIPYRLPYDRFLKGGKMYRFVYNGSEWVVNNAEYDRSLNLYGPTNLANSLNTYSAYYMENGSSKFITIDITSEIKALSSIFNDHIDSYGGIISKGYTLVNDNPSGTDVMGQSVLLLPMDSIGATSTINDIHPLFIFHDHGTSSVDKWYYKKIGFSTETKTATAYASSWSSGAQSITINGITSDDTIMVGIASTATQAQYDACCSAKIICTGLTTNTIILTCYGTVPEVNIPIIVTIMG